MSTINTATPAINATTPAKAVAQPPDRGALVAPHGADGPGGPAAPELAARRGPRIRPARFLDQAAEVHGAWPGALARVAREREQVVDQPAHSAARDLHTLEIAVRPLVEDVAVVVEHELTEPVHRAQRQPQVVGDRVTQRLELAVVVLELAHRGLELGGAREHALLEGRVEAPDFLLRADALADVAKDDADPRLSGRIGEARRRHLADEIEPVLAAERQAPAKTPRARAACWDRRRSRTERLTCDDRSVHESRVSGR
jgi:hypothetical protein